MTQSTTAPGIRGMVGQLTRIAEREDRGALAALRRGLGKESGAAAEMYPYVEWAFEGQAPDAAYIVASLFGVHRHHATDEGHPRGLGASLRAIRRNDAGEEDDGVVRRFTALLDCHAEALPTHLRHLVTLLTARTPKDRPEPIDFVQLFWDIRDWDDIDRHVQKRWAAGFWGYRPGDTGSALTDDAATAPDDDDRDDN